MKGKRLLMLISVVCLALAILAMPFMVACAKPAPAPAPAPGPAPAPAPAPAPGPEPITLKLVSFLPPPVMYGAGLSTAWFVDRVNSRAKGELVIDWIGGPEVVPMFEQFDACAEGVVDIYQGPGSHYEPRIPHVAVLGINPLTPKEERETGLYDFLNERFHEVGIQYLGRLAKYKPFHIYTNEPVASMADFKGMKISGQGTYHLGFIEQLGAAPVSIPHTDVYSAVERGLVDACCYEPATLYVNGVYEVVDYIVTPAYKSWDNMTLLMNLNTWNSLPEHLQKLIMEDVMPSIEGEVLFRDYGMAMMYTDWAKAEGLEVIELPKAEQEAFTSIYAQVAWDIMEESISAEDFSKLKELSTK